MSWKRMTIYQFTDKNGIVVHEHTCPGEEEEGPKVRTETVKSPYSEQRLGGDRVGM